MQNILLAAGMATRSDGEKLFYPWKTESVVAHAVRSSLEAGLFTIVVTGHRADEVNELILPFIGKNLLVVHNPDYASGQGSSTQVGALALKEDRPFFISLADMPLIEAHHYRTLAERFSGGVLRPRYQGKAGHPVLLDPSYIQLIQAQRIPFTMRALLSGYPIDYLDTEEEAFIRDVDSASSYQDLIESLPRP